MANEGGLWINIAGSVSRRLLQGLDELQSELRELAVTAKTASNVQLGNGLDRLSKKIDQVKKSVTGGMVEMADATDRYHRSVVKGSQDVSKALNKQTSSVSKATKKQAEDIDSLKEKYADVSTRFDEITRKPIPTGKLETEAYRRDLRKLLGQIERYRDTIEKVEGPDVFEEMRHTVLQLQDDLDKKLQPSFVNVRDEIREIRQSLKEGKIINLDEIERSKKRLGELSKELETFISRGIVPRTTVRPMQVSLRKMGEQLDTLKVKADRAFEYDAADAEAENFWKNFRKRIQSISDMDIEFLPTGQLTPLKSEITSLNKELFRLKEVIPSEEWQRYSDILENAGDRIKALTKKTSAYNEVGGQTDDMLKRMWRSFDRLSHNILRQAHLWGLLGAVTVGIQAAYAALGVAAMNAANNIGEMSNKLNMSIEDLQNLQGAAVMTGTSVRDFRDALSELNTSVTDALEGQSTAKDAFDSLGIGFETLVSKGNDTSEMFKLVMKRLEDVDSTAKRISIAEDIFGEGAASSLINLVGSVEEAQNVFKEFDLMLSEDLVESSGEVWNKIRLLWIVIKRQFISAAAEGAEKVSDLADRFLGLAKQGNIFKGTVVPAIEMTASLIRNLLPALKTFGEMLYAAYKNFDLLLIPIKALMGYALVSFFNRLRAAILRTSSSVGVLRASLGALTKATGFFLLFEVVSKVISKIHEMNRLVSESPATWKQAGKIAAEDFLNAIINGFTMIGDAILGTFGTLTDSLDAYFYSLGLQIGRTLIGAIKEIPGASYVLGLSDVPSANWSKPIEKMGAAFSKGIGDMTKQLAVDWNRELVNLTDKQTDEIYNKWKKKQDEMGEFEFDVAAPEYSEGEDKGGMAELIKGAELASSNMKDLQSLIEDLKKEGEAARVADLVPLAKEQVKEKLKETEKQIETVKKALDKTGIEEDTRAELEQNLEKLKLHFVDLLNKKEELDKAFEIAQQNKWAEQFEKDLDRINGKFRDGSSQWIKAVRNLTEEYRSRFDQLNEETKNKVKELEREASKEAFDRAEGLADARKKAALAGLEEEKDRYKLVKSNQQDAIAYVEKEEDIVLENVRKKLEAERSYQDSILEAYDKRLAFIKDRYSKESLEYKELQAKRLEIEKNTTQKIRELEDKLVRERIREQGKLIDKVKLGLNNWADEFESKMKDMADMSEFAAKSMTDELGGALSDFVLRTKSAKEAWNQFVNNLMQSITKMMTNYMVKRFTSLAIGAMGSGTAGATRNMAASSAQQQGLSPQAAGSTGGNGWINMLTSIGSALVGSMHRGGIVGQTNPDTRSVDTAQLANMMIPRLHNGLRSDEFLSVLQKGEEVIPKDQTSDKRDQERRSIVQNINVSTGPDGKIAKESLEQLHRKAGRALNSALRRS